VILVGLFLLLIFAYFRCKCVFVARDRALDMLRDLASEFVGANKKAACNIICRPDITNEQASMACDLFAKMSQRWRGCLRYDKQVNHWTQFFMLHRWSFQSLYPQWHHKMVRILFLDRRDQYHNIS